jgi:hypothetical protein
MTDLDLLESRLQGLQRRMNRVGHRHPRLGAGMVVALAPVGDTRTMTRALRRHRSLTYARRAQRTHLRQAHPDGAVDCVCERSVWFLETRKISQHRHHCWMCHPSDRDTQRWAWVKRYMTCWGSAHIRE